MSTDTVEGNYLKRQRRDFQQVSPTTTTDGSPSDIKGIWMYEKLSDRIPFQPPFKIVKTDPYPEVDESEDSCIKLLPLLPYADDGIQDHDAKHEYLFVSKLKPCDVRVVDISTISIVSFRVTVEVPVNESIIEESLCHSFAQLGFDDRPPRILFENNHRIIGMTRNHGDVAIKNHHLNTSVTLPCITDQDWSRLSLAAHVAKSFKSVNSFEYSSPSSVVKGDQNILPREGYKFVLIQLRFVNFPKRLAAALESCDSFFQSLSPIDRMVLLKESAIELGFIRTWLVLDSKSEVISKPCLNNKLLISMHHNAYRMKGSNRGGDEPVYEQYRRLAHNDWVDERIRDDHLFTQLFFFYCLYQDRVGLFAKESVERERQIYHGLLEKYIQAKVDGGEWRGTTHEIWIMIGIKLKQISRFRIMFENMTLASICSTSESVLASHDVKLSL